MEYGMTLFDRKLEAYQQSRRGLGERVVPDAEIDAVLKAAVVAYHALDLATAVVRSALTDDLEGVDDPPVELVARVYDHLMQVHETARAAGEE